jgi:hypothetical protein
MICTSLPSCEADFRVRTSDQASQGRTFGGGRLSCHPIRVVAGEWPAGSRAGAGRRCGAAPSQLAWGSICAVRQGYCVERHGNYLVSRRRGLTWSEARTSVRESDRLYLPLIRPDCLRFSRVTHISEIKTLTGGFADPGRHCTRHIRRSC